jgi:hypothetical protein
MPKVGWKKLSIEEDHKTIMRKMLGGYRHREKKKKHCGRALFLGATFSTWEAFERFCKKHKGAHERHEDCLHCRAGDRPENVKVDPELLDWARQRLAEVEARGGFNCIDIG